jgi:TolB-like protein/tetratricopeptide (TPR) repeat protein
MEAEMGAADGVVPILKARKSGADTQIRPGLPVQAIRQQLNKILSSQEFARAERMSRFLRYIVEQTLKGGGSQLKEYLVGVEVFDRGEAFDPRTDPVVRGEARRLRVKLREYYESEGRTDPIRFALPKGSYIPAFEIAAAPGDALEPSQPQPHSKAIAVLPFVNLSSESENEYFSDGLTEEIIHALGKIREISVVARTSVFQFKGKAYDIRKLGEQLNVQTVLEGSVRKSGERLRITAQLISASDGYHLWSETYEREMKDIFSIQEEISNAIVGTLRQRLASQAEFPPVRRARENIEAYHLFLKGRFHSRKRTGEGIHKAIDYFQRTIETDPYYAAAYAGLAESLTLLAMKGLAPSEVLPRARTAALQAIALDDHVPEAHVALGFVRSNYDCQWNEAERHYRRAIGDGSSGHTEALHWYASDYLAPLGRLDEAMNAIEQAQVLDPLSHLVNASLGFILIMRREFERAVEHYLKCLELDVNYYHFHTGLGRAYAQLGKLEPALRHFQKGRMLSGNLPYVTAVLAHCLGLMGRRREATELRAELVEQSRKHYIPSASVAFVYLGLNQMDHALDWLEKACEQRECTLAYLRIYPTYEPLRSEPRFQALVRKLGLDSVETSGR